MTAMATVNRRSRDLRGHAWRRLQRDAAAMAALAVVAVFAVIAMLAWAGLAGADWSRASGEAWAGAGPEHWFGTNRLGQDVFSRVVQGTGVAFHVALLVTAGAIALGAGLGALSGWRHGHLADDAVLWLAGVLDAMPFYLFVAALAFAMHGNPWAMHIAMIATFWTTTARLVRAEVMRLREAGFVESARAIGLPGWRIVLRHVLPNTTHLLLVQGSLTFVAAIKTEVILSFLGLGVQDGVSWGLMLAESTQDVLAGHFGNFLAASGFLFALLMAFNLLADALQDALDVRGAGA